MESSGPTKGYSIPNLHRMLSDLTGLFHGHISGKRKIIMGGDLNASTQLDEMQNNNSHKILFDRIDDFGLKDVFQLSGNKCHVQTLRHSRSIKPWQNDYFFVSDRLAERFSKYEIIDNEKIGRYSDHNVVIMEIDL
jgi:exodeoxyribonuclease-3